MKTKIKIYLGCIGGLICLGIGLGIYLPQSEARFGANQKISDLPALTTTDSDDLLLLVDTSASANKKITFANLEDSLRTPTGMTNATTTLLTVSTKLYLGTATTTGTNGLDISGGCFAINGVCVSGGGGGGSGTVTSVAMTVPTGLTITGSPITTSGTLALGLDTGYVIASTTRLNQHDTAYSWGNHALGGYLSASAYYATTTHPYISSLPSLSITKSQVSDFGTYENPLTFNSPLTRSTNTISLDTSGTWTGNAGTATALAANPTDCSANTWANAIAANGNLTCGSLTDADIPDTITASNYLSLVNWFATTTIPQITTAVNLTSIGNASATTTISSGVSILSAIEFYTSKVIKLLSGAIADFTGGTTKLGTTTITDGSVTGNITPYTYPSIIFASSTPMTATSTFQIRTAPVNETWTQAVCRCDSGSALVQFYNGTAKLNLISVSTTPATTTLSTNNAFLAGVNISADVGSPVSSPTQVICVPKVYRP
jgi:hypothetical protein